MGCRSTACGDLCGKPIFGGSKKSVFVVFYEEQAEKGHFSLCIHDHDHTRAASWSRSPRCSSQPEVTSMHCSLTQPEPDSLRLDLEGQRRHPRSTVTGR